VKVGVIGSQFQADIHVASIQQMGEEAEVVAIASPSPGNAERLARRYGMTALPKLLLLARDGKVLLQPAGVGELEECLREGARKQESAIRGQRSEVRGQEADK